MKKYIIWLLILASCNTGIDTEKLIQGDSTLIDTTLKVVNIEPHFDQLITKALVQNNLVGAGTQRYGTYLTTQNVTLDKINSFRGFLRGIRLRFGTSDINTGTNTYNYFVLDNAVNIATTNRLSVLFQMWRNPLQQSPSFWRAAPYNIPVVQTDDNRADLNQYSYYFDPNYIPLCDAATNALALHLKGYTTEQKQTIIAWLGSFGVTGDYAAYKGTPLDKKFIIQDTAWTTYAHASAVKLIAANKQNAWLNIALNPNNTAEDWDLDLSLGVRFFKVGELGHGYGQDGEGTFFRRVLNTSITYPELVCFSESEGVQDDTSWKAQDFFPLVASFTTSGSRILSVAATDNVTDTSLAFLNLYAGSTTGGYSYMRDAIDYADSVRFKPQTYGSVIDSTKVFLYQGQINRINKDSTIGEASRAEKRSVVLVKFINPNRVTKIQNEYIPKGYLFYPNSIHNNDGGIDLWRGNYEMRLHMKSFEGYGINRVGDENGAFGRYTRAIKYAAWDSDDSTISSIKLTYFDNRASWSVRVANGQGATLLKVVNCTNTKAWKQLTLPVTNFKKRGVNGNDIVISANRGMCVLQIIEDK